jgi:ribosomal protein S18 acetylase RimI-like enzyme
MSMDKSYNTDKLLNFLRKVDHDFSPSLSSKVNLADYVKKISEQAKLIIRYSTEREIIGFAVLYCNDTNEMKAYVSLVAVSKDHRSKGHASDMMQEAIRHVRDSGYNSIGIHTNNPHAMSLYKNLGFKIISGTDRVYMELDNKQNAM